MKRTFEITPGKAVGPVAFGMTRMEVHAAVGGAGVKFEKSPLRPSPAEAFDAVGLVVYYSPQVEKAVAIELTPPAKALLRGKDLLKMNAKQLRAHLKGEFLEEEAGFTSVGHSLSAYSPEEYLRKTAPVESICLAATIQYLMPS